MVRPPRKPHPTPIGGPCARARANRRGKRHDGPEVTAARRAPFGRCRIPPCGERRRRAMRAEAAFGVSSRRGLMRSYRAVLTMNVPARMDFVNITREVEEAVARERRSRRASASSTRCTSPPRSSSTTTSRACTRTTSAGSSSSPPSTRARSRYHHNRTGEDNGDAHHKRQIMGREVVVAITDGQARLRPLGADLLRRVRRPPAQARAGQDHRRVDATSGPRGCRPRDWPRARGRRAGRRGG